MCFIRNTLQESRKIVKWNTDSILEWLRKTVGATYIDFQERLNYLKVSILIIKKIILIN